jgi:hypothetical protein
VASGTSASLAPEHEREIAAFFRAHPLAAGPRTLRQIREELGHARRYESVLGRQLETYLGRTQGR